MDIRPDHFPASYESSRDRFREDLAIVRAHWPEAHLDGYAVLSNNEDLSIDWIIAEPSERKQKLVMLTTGEHGIEGFVGSAVMQIFIEEFLPQLDPRNTGLLLVHAINPWGFKHHRRVNRSNVDLNRNFGWQPGNFNLSANMDYSKLNELINPRVPLSQLALRRVAFSARALWDVLRMGRKHFTTATLLGQYSYPRGIYFGGDQQQEESQILSNLYYSSLAAYEEVLLLDMHTGYGPRHPMSIVTSHLEPDSSGDLSEEFAYPRVVKSNPKEFYSIQGDMIDYIYSLTAREFPEKTLFAASFEFGTFGSSLTSILRSLRAAVFENQVYWYGARDEATRDWVEQEYRELFFPSDERWQARAMNDSRQAFAGILKARQFTASM
jgi:hypothetical protein